MADHFAILKKEERTLMKKLLICLLIFACSPDKKLFKAQTITEFDSTGGRYSELIVANWVSSDFDIDDFVSIGTAAGALRENCEVLYKADKAPKKANGLRDETTLNYLFCTMTKQYKMRRISNTEVERTRFFIKNLTVIVRSTVLDTLNDTENKNGERIDVPLWIKRRLKHDRHNIFEEVGNEEWFGGGTDFSFETLSAFWDSVLVREPSSMSRRDAMKRNYPVHFLKKYRVFRMQDISDSSASDLTLPDTTKEKNKKFQLSLSVADSTLIAGISDTREIKTFSFNTNKITKTAK